MKKTVVIIAFCIIGISPLANAALTLNQVNSKTATVETDSSLALGFYLSIPSTIDYSIETAPPFEVGPIEDLGDGLDWIPVFSISPEPPVGTLATFTLAGPEIFALGSYELNLWDDTTANNLGTLTIVPEPATLMLLGLGGLLIRKRK
jgi:hypothetical protein